MVGFNPSSQHTGKPADLHLASQVLNIAPPPTHRASATPSAAPTLTYDPHWLAIVRATAQFQSITPNPSALPPPAVLNPLLTASYAWVLQHIGEGKRVDEVQMFVHTAQPTINNEEMERPGEGREREFFSPAGQRRTPC